VGQEERDDGYGNEDAKPNARRVNYPCIEAARGKRRSSGMPMMKKPL